MAVFIAQLAIALTVFAYWICRTGNPNTSTAR